MSYLTFFNTWVSFKTLTRSGYHSIHLQMGNFTHWRTHGCAGSQSSSQDSRKSSNQTITRLAQAIKLYSNIMCICKYIYIIIYSVFGYEFIFNSMLACLEILVSSKLQNFGAKKKHLAKLAPKKKTPAFESWWKSLQFFLTPKSKKGHLSEACRQIRWIWTRLDSDEWLLPFQGGWAMLHPVTLPFAKLLHMHILIRRSIWCYLLSVRNIQKVW